MGTEIRELHKKQGSNWLNSLLTKKEASFPKFRIFNFKKAKDSRKKKISTWMSCIKKVYKNQDEWAREKQYVLKNNLYFTSEQKIYFYVCFQNISRKKLFELQKQPKFILSIILMCHFIERHTEYSGSKILFCVLWWWRNWQRRPTACGCTVRGDCSFNQFHMNIWVQYLGLKEEMLPQLHYQRFFFNFRLINMKGKERKRIHQIENKGFKSKVRYQLAFISTVRQKLF